MASIATVTGTFMYTYPETMAPIRDEMVLVHDVSGARRFWPVRVNEVDREALARDRNQLWAETVDLYKPDLKTMNAWGTRRVDIEVIREGSYAKSLEILKGRMKAPHVRKMVHSITSKRRS